MKSLLLRQGRLFSARRSCDATAVRYPPAFQTTPTSVTGLLFQNHSLPTLNQQIKEAQFCINLNSRLNRGSASRYSLRQTTRLTETTIDAITMGPRATD